MKQKLCYLIILIQILSISACAQKEQEVTVEQVVSNYPTILYANLEKGKIIGVQFYLTFDMTNNSNEDISVGLPEYIYKGKYARDVFKGSKTGIPIYFNQNGIMKFALDDKEIANLTHTPKRYIFPTSNNTSNDSLVQSFFTSYLEKMKIENKDTLHIGTISELKKQNSPIVQLLEGDSIIISFRGRDDLYRDPIPVQIK